MNLNKYKFFDNLAFSVISIFGLAYFLGLAYATYALLPKALEHSGYVIQMVQVNCTVETIVGATVTYPMGLLVFVLTALWLKFIFAVIKLVKNIINTNNYLLSLEIIKVNGNTVILENANELVFTAGFWQPKIYYTQKILNILTKAELESVIKHEEYHLKNKDPLKKLISAFLKDLLPYFPTKNIVLQNYLVLNELAADNNAMLTNSKHNLVSALLKIIDNVSTVSLKFKNNNFVFAGFAEPANRIDILVGKAQFKSKTFFTLISFAVFFFALIISRVGQINAEALVPEFSSAVQCPAFRPFSPVQPTLLQSQIR